MFTCADVHSFVMSIASRFQSNFHTVFDYQIRMKESWPRNVLMSKFHIQYLCIKCIHNNHYDFQRISTQNSVYMLKVVTAQCVDLNLSLLL
jgi:hypothetical protein